MSAIRYSSDGIGEYAERMHRKFRGTVADLDQRVYEVLMAFQLRDGTERDDDDLFEPWQEGVIRRKVMGFRDAVASMVFPTRKYVSVGVRGKGEPNFKIEAIDDYVWFLCQHIQLHRRARGIIQHATLTPGMFLRPTWTQRWSAKHGRMLGHPDFQEIPFWLFGGDVTRTHFRDAAVTWKHFASAAEMRARAKSGIYDHAAVEKVLAEFPQGDGFFTEEDTPHVTMTDGNDGQVGYWITEFQGYNTDDRQLPHDRPLVITCSHGIVLRAVDSPLDQPGVVITTGVDPAATWLGDPFANTILPFERNKNRLMAPFAAGVRLAAAPPVAFGEADRNSFGGVFGHIPGEILFLKDPRGMNVLNYPTNWGAVAGMMQHMTDAEDQLSAVAKNITAGDPKAGVSKLAQQQQQQGVGIRLGQDADQISAQFTVLLSQMLDMLVEFWDEEEAFALSGDPELLKIKRRDIQAVPLVARVDAFSRQSVNDVERQELLDFLQVAGNPMLAKHLNSREVANAAVKVFFKGIGDAQKAMLPEDIDPYAMQMEQVKAMAEQRQQMEQAGVMVNDAMGPGGAGAPAGAPMLPGPVGGEA